MTTRAHRQLKPKNRHLESVHSGDRSLTTQPDCGDYENKPQLRATFYHSYPMLTEVESKKVFSHGRQVADVIDPKTAL